MPQDEATSSAVDVGLYFHPSFRARPRLSWVPGPLRDLRAPEVTEVPSHDTLLRVHSGSLVERVEGGKHRDLALLSSAVVMAAAREVRARGGRAMALPAVGGHHAGRAFFGGMCLLNDVAIALSDLRTRGPWRAAVLDTDAHHADGSMDTLGPDVDTMYVCVCTEGFPPPYPEKFDVRVAPGISGDAYLEATLAAYVPRVRRFRPDMLVWYMGFDLLEGEYASLGFGTDVLRRLAQALASLADQETKGRLLVVLGGGKDGSRAEEAIWAAVRGLSEPGTLPDLPAKEPVAREAPVRETSREWVEMTFGPLGSGAQKITLGGETLTGPEVLSRMGVWAEGIDPIDLVTVEEGRRWAVRFFDGEDRRVVVLQFSPDLAILSETRVHIKEWMGTDYFEFDWPAGCPWPI
ncbi:MAG TPA: hypothetical protein VGL18_16965 [Actinomycetota bacterium]